MIIYMVVDYPEVRGYFNKEDAEKRVTDHGGYIRELPVMGELSIYGVGYPILSEVFFDGDKARQLATTHQLPHYRFIVKE